ncbi:putative xylanase/chitin deacetylase [Thaumarchaeota archaeon SCGC AB-539-E09]|nr:putative xylanase/chitin deacetylase [Thaumarchaeota archaeon SCGC AB-539-E09]
MKDQSRPVIITTSWDDGAYSDLELAYILKKYDIPSTFYLPIKNSERSCLGSEEIRKISSQFDVGGHSLNHVNLTQIPMDEAKREILECKNALSEITGKEIKMFCYPFGAYNEGVVESVRQAKYLGARTDKLSKTGIDDVFRLGTTVIALDVNRLHYVKETMLIKNFKMAQNLLKNVKTDQWIDIAIASLDYVVKNGGVWHLRGHSWEIDENNDWEKLENICVYIKDIEKTHNNIMLLNNSELVTLYNNYL